MMQNSVIASKIEILMKEIFSPIFCVTPCYCIPYSAYFSGVKCSWIWKFLLLRGNIFVVECSLNKPHTPCSRREIKMASYFEAEAILRGYHQYKEIWDA